MDEILTHLIENGKSLGCYRTQKDGGFFIFWEQDIALSALVLWIFLLAFFYSQGP